MFFVSQSYAVVGPAIYYGIDAGAGIGDLRPNADAAEAAFRAAIISLETCPLTTIDFEYEHGYNTGNFTSMVLPDAPDVTMSQSGNDSGGANFIGGISNDGEFPVGHNIVGYNTTVPTTGLPEPDQFVRLVPEYNMVSTLTFTFNNPLCAWGAYLTGVGTEEGDLSISLYDQSGSFLDSIDVNGDPTGGVLYMGFISDREDVYKVELTLSNVPNVRDVFGLDDLSYCVVPEPATVFLLVIGGLGLLKRKSSVKGGE